MDPITAVGLVGSVVGITDIVVRSLNGLRTLQAQYGSADRRVAMTRGNLQSVKGALDEIHEWADGLNDEVKSRYASLLEKIEFAVQCCAIPLETLCESIETLKSKADGGGLTKRGKLAAMLGETELREMSVHLGNQVQALNLLLMAAFCKTQHGVTAVLQHDDTRLILRQVEDDSASYVQREIETASVMTRRSVISDHDELLESTFEFDSIILDSRAYRQAFETVIDERRRRHHGAAPIAQNTAIIELTAMPPAHAVAEAQSETSPVVESSFLRPGSSGSDGTIRNPADENEHEEQVANDRPATTSRAFSQNGDSPAVSELQITRQKSVPILSSGTRGPLKSKPKEEKLIAKPQKNRGRGLFSKILSIKDSEREALARSEEIDRQLRRDQQASRNEIKMLFLGTSESGKSTLLKQMKLIHEGSYTTDERNAFKEIIFDNAIQGMRVILEAMESLEMPLETESNDIEYHVQTIFMQPLQIEGEILPHEVGSAIKELWKDAGVQECYERRREYQLNTCAKYLFDNIDRIARSDYIPTDEDVLRSRVKTTGITETTFIIGDITYRVFDVGGVRSERKKWIHAFEQVTVVVFLVDISAYDLLLFEDENVNRMQEALLLFDAICNSRWFTKTTMVLFLNKIDLFKDKLPVSPMVNYFPDYEGGANYEAACDYVLSRFVSLNQHETKQIFTHFICCTDTTQIRFAFAAVGDIIVQENLRMCGLLQ